MRVVLDLDLGAEVADQTIERLALGAAHVGRRDYADGNAGSRAAREFALEEPQAVPHHEGAQQIDRVRGVELGAKLRGQTRLAMGVGQEAASLSGVFGRLRRRPSSPGPSGRRTAWSCRQETESLGSGRSSIARSTAFAKEMRASESLTA